MGSKFLDRAVKLRGIETPHYNCAQSTMLPFAEELGVDGNVAYNLTTNFGSGMKCGSTCGAVVGAIMALGLYGIDDVKTLNRFYEEFKNTHENCMDCADLLKIDTGRNESRHEHCSRLVYDCIELVEKIIDEKK